MWCEVLSCLNEPISLGSRIGFVVIELQLVLLWGFFSFQSRCNLAALGQHRGLRLLITATVMKS